MDYESLDDIQDAFGLTRSHPFWVLPGIGPSCKAAYCISAALLCHIHAFSALKAMARECGLCQHKEGSVGCQQCLRAAPCCSTLWSCQGRMH